MNRVQGFLGAIVMGAAAFVAAAEARAEEVTFRFEARVTRAGGTYQGYDGLAGIGVGPLSVGTVVSGTFAVDTAWLDTDPTPEIAQYRPPVGSTAAFDMTLGARRFHLGISEANVHDNYTFSGWIPRYYQDSLQVNTVIPSELQDGVTYYYRFFVNLAATLPFPPAAITSVAVPRTAPDLALFPYRMLTLNVGVRGSRGGVIVSTVEAEITGLELLVQDVALDVKPGSSENPVNLKAKGVLPVAVLTTDEFDAADVDADSVTVGDPALGEAIAPARSRLDDVDGDGRLDLLLHLDVPDLVAADAIGAGTTVLAIHGETLAGVAIHGEDAVTIVPK